MIKGFSAIGWPRIWKLNHPLRMEAPKPKSKLELRKSGEDGKQIEFESQRPVRLAYRSFEAFLKDALTANLEISQLKCFSV